MEKTTADYKMSVKSLLPGVTAKSLASMSQAYGNKPTRRLI